jgi:hypothetical protein
MYFVAPMFRIGFAVTEGFCAFAWSNTNGGALLSKEQLP